MATKKPLSVRTIQVGIIKGKTGLYYGTSKELKGLLIAAETKDAVLESVPKIIADLYHASGVDDVNLVQVKVDTWIAQPRS